MSVCWAFGLHGSYGFALDTCEGKINVLGQELFYGQTKLGAINECGNYFYDIFYRLFGPQSLFFVLQLRGF